MKSIHFVLLFLLIIAGITGYILLTEPPVGAAGVPHATIQGMSAGGDGAARLATIGKAPFYFQIIVILLAVSLLTMAVHERLRDTRFYVLMGSATAFALFVWYKVYSGYEAYLATGETDIVFGFPVPTTWMLWGIWGSFVLFDLIFVFFFRNYFYTHEDEQAFEQLVAELNAEKDSAAKQGDA
ncbi:MAG: hypothetical protein COB37_10315 [Kordiimonadales bacterium]|nr:MAG: hypothetical protein COB37_10315 [Kordiimonadales bacterium]